MITYTQSLDEISAAQLTGFFVGWPNPPSPGKLLEILSGSAYIVLAIDTRSGQVIGFINAVSDRILAAYIPLLEVLPTYQDRGISTRLMTLMKKTLSDLYIVDLVCDKDLQPFYSQFGMKPMTAMMIRNYDKQSGRTCN